MAFDDPSFRFWDAVDHCHYFQCPHGICDNVLLLERYGYYLFDTALKGLIRS